MTQSYSSKICVQDHQRLLTRMDKLEDNIVESSPMDFHIGNDEVLLRLQRFALTTNNITYAAFGDSIGYWQFFPTQRQGWGHMPVWGIATVVASGHADVSEGQRFFGYFPMASHLKVQAHRVSERGFRDSTDYRQPLPSAYNYYTKLAQPQPGINPLTASGSSHEDYNMLLRALFLTSYMLADYLKEMDFFGAKQLVISSASSKTAYGSAFCLAQHKGLKLIALTSADNQSFVKGLDIYQQVTAYEDLKSLHNTQPTLYIDFSGQDQLRASVHQHFGEQLKHDCYAGSASNLAFLDKEQQSEVNAQFFFAALHIKKRNQELGAAVVSQGLEDMQARFINRVSAEDKPWLELDISNGLSAAKTVVEALCNNSADPKRGYIVTMQP